jgi:HEAT repeat protein
MPQKESDLLSVLRSQAAKSKKADACKDLAVYGSKAAVPDLAGLLADEQLASWARIALEAIPGPEADDALRRALGSLHGNLLVGVVNSIGVRRDAAAVEPLIAHLRDHDAEVASAAAAALGHIGNSAADQSLRRSLAAAPSKVRSAIAEGLVLCAERRLLEGRTAEAVAIFDEVRKAAVPKQRIIEATRGAILARKDAGIPLLLEQLRSSDKSLMQLALVTAREFPGRQVDEALAAEIDRAAPGRAALLIFTMAGRKQTVILPAVLKAARSGPRPVRLAAVDALGRVGDGSCLSTLLDIALESDGELAQTAKASLADLPGKDVDETIVARLRGAHGQIYPLLIELVGERRIQAIDDLVAALDDSDGAVRGAALTSLGTTVPANKLSILISQVVSPKYGDDAPVAERALKSACIRMPDREATAKEIAVAITHASVPTKIALLQIQSAVGGTEALASVAVAAKSSDPQLQDASSRLLGSWMTIDAKPVLFDLAKSAPGEKYRVRALRGYIRIARQFTMPEPERLAMCRDAFQAAKEPAERKLVLDILKRYPSLETLKMAAQVTQDVPDLNKDATQTTFAIAQKLGEKSKGEADKVRDVLSKARLDKVKLEIVKAEYGAGATQKDVTKTLQKRAADLQLVSLPSSGYAALFEDPVPGTPKRLKIQYRINGKAGEASFAENALVILPMPK